MVSVKKGQVRVITGNSAGAYGAMLCRPDVVASYPITPMSELVEQLSSFHADGILHAEMVEAEGENTTMNTIIGASMAGARAFTATSSAGLAFMFDAFLMAAGYRAPVVMVNVNRELTSIFSVSCGQQDIWTVREAGWVQIAVENCQEILDSVIMAFRLAEDYDIQLPVMVCYDGYYLSFNAEAVEIPAIEDVDNYLAPLKKQPERPKIIPGQPTGCAPHGILEGFMELRYKHAKAMARVPQKLDEIDTEFKKSFGRSYGGQIEEYRTEDADIVLVTSGSVTGTARVVVDAKRAEGLKVGLVKLRMFRPFPREKLAKVLKGKKAIGVIDRSVSFGWDCGPMYVELRALTPDIGIIPMLDYIDGLANLDITIPHIERVVNEVNDAAHGKPYQEVTWIPMEE
jgi:pyruvate/2-oxoacid:ferredoxin oxidoreductase alpha subunit